MVRRILPVHNRFLSILVLSVAMATTDSACGQTPSAGNRTYPSKPLRILTSGIGGNADFTARLIAPGLAAAMGQQVIVDNRATGGIIQEIVAASLPDGYNLLLTSASHWILPLLQKMRYDPVRDFSPITLALSSPAILVVHPDLPAKSVKELIAMARTEPGKLNYATTGTGTSNHLAAELFKSMSEVNIVRINYKSAAAALGDLLGGRVQMMFATSGSVTPHVKSARLRALAVSSARTSSTFPDLPTIAAAGVAGYESVSVIGIYAPAKTPAAVISRLNRDIVEVLKTDDVKEKSLRSGADTIGSTPEELAAIMKLDMARMGKVIRDAGIRDE